MFNFEDEIVSQQAKFGREMAAADTGYSSANGRKGIGGAKRGVKSNKKPEGHEAFLKMLETSKAEIKITTLEGAEFFGIIRHSDKYTISIKDGEEGTRVFFKHAIEQFEPTTPAPARENLNEE